jgi:hypothetical protein
MTSQTSTPTTTPPSTSFAAGRALARRLGLPLQLVLTLRSHTEDQTLIRGRAELTGERLRVTYAGEGWTLRLDIVGAESPTPRAHAWASTPGCETGALINRPVSLSGLRNLQALLPTRPRRGAAYR